MQISFNVLYKRPVGITIIALFVIGGAHFGSQAFYGDSPKIEVEIEVEDEEENQFQISLSSSPLATLKFSPMREAANSYSQAASRASFTRMWHRSMLAKNRVEMANDSGDEGKCPPKPPLPPEKRGPFERIDRVPPSRTHDPCEGDHKHTWWYEVHQEPYPSCKNHTLKKHGPVECL